MVLQNKYKARASAQYQKRARGRGIGGAARQGGEGQDGDGGEGSSYRARRGSGRGRGRGRGAAWANPFRGERPDEDGEDGDLAGEDSEDEEETEDDPAFPSLRSGAAATAHSNAKAKDDGQGQDEEDEGDGTARVGGKYARRPMESNAWRYKEPERDPHEEVEPEPEVDLSAFLSKQLSLYSSATPTSSMPTFAQVQERDDSAEIDHSLAYLNRSKRGRKNGGDSSTGWSVGDKGKARIAGEEEKRVWNLEELRIEREKAEAVRDLKARFLAASQPRPRPGKSISIGQGSRTTSASASGPTAPTRASTSASVPPSSHSSERRRAKSGEVRVEEEEAEAGHKGGDVDDIDAFLSNLSPGSASSSVEPSDAAATRATPTRRPPPAPATVTCSPTRRRGGEGEAKKGDKREMEAFLDDMLG